MIGESSPFSNKSHEKGNLVGNLDNYFVYDSFDNCWLMTLDIVIAIKYKY